MTQTEIKNKWLNGVQLDGLYTFDEAVKAVKNLEGQRIPNGDDWEELFDNTEYSFDEKKKEGVFTFQDKTEIRLPAEGYRNDSTGASYNQGANGNYWSSSVSSNSTYTRYMYFNSAGRLNANTRYRAYGYSVRCVKDEGVNISNIVFDRFEQDKGKEIVKYHFVVLKSFDKDDIRAEKYYVIAKDEFNYYAVSKDSNCVEIIGIGFSVNSPYMLNCVDVNVKPSDFDGVIITLFTDKGKEESFKMIKDKFLEEVHKTEWFKKDACIKRINDALCLF